MWYAHPRTKQGILNATSGQLPTIATDSMSPSPSFPSLKGFYWCVRPLLGPITEGHRNRPKWSRRRCWQRVLVVFSFDIVVWQHTVLHYPIVWPAHELAPGYNNAPKLWPGHFEAWTNLGPFWGNRTSIDRQTMSPSMSQSLLTRVHPQVTIASGAHIKDRCAIDVHKHGWKPVQLNIGVRVTNKVAHQGRRGNTITPRTIDGVRHAHVHTCTPAGAAGLYMNWGNWKKHFFKSFSVSPLVPCNKTTVHIIRDTSCQQMLLLVL